LTQPDEITVLANRCLLPGLPGPVLDDLTRRWLDDGLGGLVLFAGNVVSPEQLALLTADLHTAGDDVLVAADEEGGDVTRLHHTTGSTTPGNLSLGAVDNLLLTREVARTIGHDLRAVGIDWALAPDVDVNTNPANPVIGTRAFSDDPDAVARHGAAFLAGLHDAGVLGCAKHFPGHGDTHVDSHFALPRVEGDLEPHLVPFRAAIAAGVDAILTAHIVFPDLDDVPATMSRRIVTGLLREELGFDGLVVTDSMSMQAVAATFGVGPASVSALAAGVDMICVNADPPTQLAIRDALVAAVRSGELSADRLAEAAGRVLTLARSGVGRVAAAEAASAIARAGSSGRTDHGTGAGRRAADAGLLVAGVSLPLPQAPFMVELAGPRRGVDSEAGSLLAAVRRRQPEADGVSLRGVGDTDRPTPDAIREAVAAAGTAPLVVVVRDGQRSITQTEAVNLLRTLRPDLILVGVGATYDRSLAGTGGYLGTRGAAAANLDAAARALVG